jgi:hypothetical protein
MTIGSKIFDMFTATIKMNDKVVHLADDVKNIMREIRDLDKRVIRLETFVEIVETQRKLAKMSVDKV